MITRLPRSVRTGVVQLLCVAGLTVLVAASATQPQRGPDTRPAGTRYTGKAFTFNQVADGVYHATGTGALAVGCNASIVVSEHDVLVVDTHMTPGGAWALRDELRAITPKPVRYVVNTHWHFDHSHGNQIYGPDTEILGHEITRRMLVEGRSKQGRSHARFVQSIPTNIDGLRGRVAASTDPAEKAKLQAQLEVQLNHQEGTDAVVPTAPTATLTDQLTLHRGGREIRLLFLGRGHTGGDVVVYLPAQKLVMTGDLLVEGISYMGDAYLADWAATLDRLKTLDFDRVLPGHGTVFGREKVDHFQAYLRDLWTQVQELQKAGVPADEAAKRIDMRSHAARYPSITSAGVLPDGVQRAYALIEGREQ